MVSTSARAWLATPGCELGPGWLPGVMTSTGNDAASVVSAATAIGVSIAATGSASRSPACGEPSGAPTISGSTAGAGAGSSATVRCAERQTA